MSDQRPQDLVFTLFGEYLLHRRRPVWVGTLIALLRPFGVSEGAVRTVLSRMTRKDWLHSRREGRHSYYRLTPRGHRLLEEGEARILHVSWDRPWTGDWCFVTYSIPEEVRHLRDRLRVRLAWLGFGSLGNGIWLCPHDVEDRVVEIARDMELGSQLLCFRGHLRGTASDEDLVHRCWDLASLNRRYHRFLHRWRPELERCTRALADGTLADEESFRLRFNLMHEYRRFPLEDPYLPRDLLPAQWHGHRADRLFNELHDLLIGPSDRYVDAALTHEPMRSPSKRAGATH
jgi:phenylacetic acid degradation operon negative regulatory protein